MHITQYLAHALHVCRLLAENSASTTILAVGLFPKLTVFLDTGKNTE